MVGTDLGVYRTLDGGATWTREQGLATALWYVEPAGRQRYSVFRSTDGGVNWHMAGIGLPEGEQMRYVAFSPRYGTDRAAYATSSKQLYRSLDGGESWTALGAPPGSPDLYDVAVDSAGHVQMASNAGVWRYTTSALVTRPMVGATKVYVPLVLRDHP